MFVHIQTHGPQYALSRATSAWGLAARLPGNVNPIRSPSLVPRDAEVPSHASEIVEHIFIVARLSRHQIIFPREDRC